MFIHFSFNLLVSLSLAIAFRSLASDSSALMPKTLSAINMGRASSASVVAVKPLNFYNLALARFTSDSSRKYSASSLYLPLISNNNR